MIIEFLQFCNFPNLIVMPTIKVESVENILNINIYYRNLNAPRCNIALKTSRELITVIYKVIQSVNVRDIKDEYFIQVQYIKTNRPVYSRSHQLKRERKRDKSSCCRSNRVAGESVPNSGLASIWWEDCERDRLPVLSAGVDGSGKHRWWWMSNDPHEPTVTLRLANESGKNPSLRDTDVAKTREFSYDFSRKKPQTLLRSTACLFSVKPAIYCANSASSENKPLVFRS